MLSRRATYLAPLIWTARRAGVATIKCRYGQEVVRSEVLTLLGRARASVDVVHRPWPASLWCPGITQRFSSATAGTLCAVTRCAVARCPGHSPRQSFPIRKWRSDSCTLMGKTMTLVKDVATGLSNLLLSAVAALGMGLLTVLFVRELPTGFDH